MKDPFYIGYLDESPPTLVRHTRRIVVLLAVMVIGLTALLAARQTPAEPGSFEFGVRRTFTGVILKSPLPLLRSVSTNGAVTHHLLVGSGKYGLPAFARGNAGKLVRFDGSLIQKGDSAMVELNAPKTFKVLGPATGGELPQKQERITEIVLTGELVDTKCYFGVMRPATGKVHRACAVRCLSGGVPPGLLVRDHEGGAVALPLTGSNNQPLKFDAEWAARIVTAKGHLILNEGLLRLEVRELSLDR